MDVKDLNKQLARIHEAVTQVVEPVMKLLPDLSGSVGVRLNFRAGQFINANVEAYGKNVSLNLASKPG